MEKFFLLDCYNITHYLSLTNSQNKLICASGAELLCDKTLLQAAENEK